jgi:FtsZ-interacting cell division protein ZipA
MKKILKKTLIVRVTIAVILLALIGIGIWQFNKYYIVSKRSTIKSQMDKILSDMNSLKKENEDLKSAKSQLESDKKGLEDKIAEMEANPKVITKTITKTVEKPVYVPQPQQKTGPSSSTCYWIGSFYYCNYY